MSIASALAEKGITRVLHFTTHKGLVGILDSQCLKSRHRVKDDERLKYILQTNSDFRKDHAWLDYINLSISRINKQFYHICSTRWHPDVSWRILSLSPDILTHDGVYFSTTNNMYTSVYRGQGQIAFERLFATQISQWPGASVARKPNERPEFTTDPQAEALYPGEISTHFVQSILVSTDSDADDVNGTLAALNHPPVEVHVAPGFFTESSHGE